MEQNSLPSARTMRRRIARALARADADTLRAGREWYATARAAAVDISRESGVDVRTAAGIIAAHSPRTRWIDNLRRAREHALGGSPGGLGANLRRADAVLGSRDPLESLGNGRKVSAFYRNIIGDSSAVTVDVWAARAAGVDASTLSRAGSYDAVAAAYRAVARAVGMPAAEVQAAVWIVTRGSAE